MADNEPIKVGGSTFIFTRCEIGDHNGCSGVEVIRFYEEPNMLEWDAYKVEVDRCACNCHR